MKTDLWRSTGLLYPLYEDLAANLEVFGYELV
jgi:hypothetical protein